MYVWCIAGTFPQMILEPLQNDKQKVINKKQYAWESLILYWNGSVLKRQVVSVSWQHSWFGQEGGILMEIGGDTWEEEYILRP